MKSELRIFADFNNTDIEGRIRLNTVGTFEDCKRKNIQFVEGLEILLDDHDELVAHGIIQFSHKENIWVAKINWEELE